MSVKHAVLVALAAALVAVLINFMNRDPLNIVIAVAFAAATYFGVYNKLPTDVGTAKNAALALAGCAGVLLLVALFSWSRSFILVNLVACGSLGYAFMQLRDLETKSGNSGPSGTSPGS